MVQVGEYRTLTPTRTSRCRWAVLALIAVSSCAPEETVQSNAVAACGHLMNILSVQTEFRESRTSDNDGDGVGEFGSFRDLVGKDARRVSSLSGAWSGLGPSGTVERSGYKFVIYLPDSRGYGIAADSPSCAGEVDSDLSEELWCCYAWPTAFGTSGDRALFVDQSGRVLYSITDSYSGEQCPRPGAARSSLGLASMRGELAVETVGQDGNVWRSY